MSHGLSHVFNNPITVVLSQISLAQLQLDKGEDMDLVKVENSLNKAKESLNKMSRLIQNLRILDADLDQVSIVAVEDCFKEIRQIAKDESELGDLNVSDKLGQASQQLHFLFEPEITQTLFRYIIQSLISMKEAKEAGMLILGFHLSSDKVSFTFKFVNIRKISGLEENIFRPFYFDIESGFNAGVELSLAKALAQRHAGDLFAKVGKDEVWLTLSFPRSEKLDHSYLIAS